MIINISNVTTLSHFKRYDYGALVSIAQKNEFTAHLSEKYFYDSAHNGFLAEVTCDKVVRGFCVCKKLLIPDSCEIEAICIDEGFKGSGLGRKLLSHALRNMRTLRFKTAFIWINEQNNDALDFFTHFGFEADGKLRKSLRSQIKGDELRLRIDI